MIARPARGVHFLPIDDTCVLFDERRGEIVSLNTTAAVIWCLLSDHDHADDLAAALARHTGLHPAQALAFVHQVLAMWSERGLLDGTIAADTSAAAPNPPKMPPYLAPDFVEVITFQFNNTRIEVRFTSPAQAELVAPLFAHLPRATVADTTVDIVTAGDEIAIYQDGSGYAACQTLVELAPQVKSLVWRIGLKAGSYLLNIHAGVVSGPKGCILLPGPSGSGKSTLTAGLVHAGLKYFSDEVALLSAPSFSVRPFPLGLCVKDTGAETISAMFPQIRHLPFHRRIDGKTVAYLPPPPDATAADQATQVAALVFPRYSAGAPLHCSDIAAADALALLLNECLHVGQTLDAGSVSALIGWVARVPRIRMVYGALSDAVAAILPVAGIQNGPDSD